MIIGINIFGFRYKEYLCDLFLFILNKILPVRLSDVSENKTVVISKLLGHGSFRRRISEMGFVAGKEVTVYQPGLGTVPMGTADVSVEGPHYPKPHTWYARVRIDNGRIVKVLS